MSEEFLSHMRQSVKGRVGFISFLLMTLLWIIISLQVHQVFDAKHYIGLREVIGSRIWLASLFLGGRYLLFPRIRDKNLLKWSFSLIFFLFIGVQVLKIFNHTVNWFHLILFITEIAVCSFFLAGLVEITGGILQYWRLLSVDVFKEIHESWQHFWRDTLKLGFLLTMFMSLTYYYFINFYLVDTVLYSYILLAPVIGVGLSFFAIVFTKIRGIFQQEINALDVKIALYLNRQDYEASGPADFLPHYQFLFLRRIYYMELKKPYISVATILWYLLFSGFILALPYLFGAVIQV